MKYIELAEHTPNAILLVAAALTIIVALIFVVAAFNGKDGVLLFMGIFILIVGSSLGVLSTDSSYSVDERSDDRIEKIQDRIDDRYDIDLSEKEVAGLKYPTEEPEGDFEVFGTIDRNIQREGSAYDRQEISLVWTGEDFELAQTEDGEKFTALSSISDRSEEEDLSDAEDKPTQEPFFEPAPEASPSAR